MALFQQSVIKKYLQELDNNSVNTAFDKFHKHFGNTEIQNNIREAKEEQYQEGFLRELFVNVLGYTLYPQTNYNLITEQKNEKDSKKADGAIIQQVADSTRVIAVIELKGTATTDLSKVEVQAFSYKNNQKDCKYVITSNFEKIRFYIDNAIDFEEFNLFNLTKDRFNLLYLCLTKENLLNGIPQKIKEASVSQEDNITKKLYSDYSAFKRLLFQNICSLNPEYDKLTLFQKTQKLLDRFLFIFFAEDRLLLPPNSIREIIKQWEQLKELDNYTPLYDRFKKYFGYMNTGFKGKQYEIFAYNGGLFAPNELLDNLKIDDQILFEHTLKLSNYDYDTEVDVNILGHIFEHSLNEIEEIQSELEGKELDKSKTKRKKDGVFYTPKYITKYIVENTVGALCTEKKKELEINDEEIVISKRKDKKKELIEKIDNYRNWLLKLTICDPACGSGAFLNQALDYLLIEHKKLDELKARITNSPMILSDIENSVLENNIFGVDLNEEAVEIAKLSLWLKTAQKGRKLSILTSNIKCGNSLIDDINIVGEKAFNWKKEFSEIFANGGFDIVIGNPPYVRAELLGNFRDYLSCNYKVFNPASDLFSFFYEKSISILKNKIGILSFISNTFDKTTAGIELRAFLQNNTKYLKYVDFTEVQIFEGATTYPVIIIMKNTVPENTNEFEFIKISKASQADIIDINLHTAVSVEQIKLNEKNWTFKSNSANDIIQKILQNKCILKKYGKSYRGLLTGLNEAFIIPSKYVIGNHVKPILEGKDVSKWYSSDSVQQLIFFPSKWTNTKYGKDTNEEIAIQKLKIDFPELFNHLINFVELAKKRYDKGEYWWELRNCAYYDLFEKPKIIFPNLQNSNKFSFDEKGTYINAPAVFLPTNDKSLLAILNSKLVWYFLTSICVVRNGGYIEVKPQYFEQIPIPELTESDKELLSNKVEFIIDKSKSVNLIDTTFHKVLISRFENIQWNKKMENWSSSSFTDFHKELNKQKIKLSFADQADLMSYFEQEKNKKNQLTIAINGIELEIDKFIYLVYGLNSDEILVVEKN